MRPALLAILVVACGCGAPSEERKAELRAKVNSLKAQLESIPELRVHRPCPATGNWADCSVFERLDRAGLAPRPDSASTVEPPLTPQGTLLHIGNSQLELYFYADLAARELDEAKLDKTKYAEHDKPLTMRPLPTLITSANLIAVLHSRNEHQRERVADAITAGPPQRPPPPPPPERP